MNGRKDLGYGLFGVIAAALTAGIWYACRASETLSMALRTAALFLREELARLCGLCPLPVSELLMLAALLGVVLLFVLCCLRRGWRGLMGVLTRLLAACGVLALLFMLLYGVQYSAPPLEESLRMEVGQYTLRELYGAAESVTREMNRLGESAPRSAEGECSFGSFEEQAEAVREAYAALAGRYTVYRRAEKSPPPRRAAILSKPMSYVGISGYFFPWSGEAVVSGDSVATHYPFYIAHEAAHALGVGPEDEANFSAFLACMSSEEDSLRYSGLINAYVYLSNALYEQDVALAREISAMVSETCRADLRRLNEHYERYETPVREAGQKINDAYIKATGQPDGVQSYGKVADFIIAWYMAR